MILNWLGGRGSNWASDDIGNEQNPKQGPINGLWTTLNIGLRCRTGRTI